MEWLLRGVERYELFLLTLETRDGLISIDARLSHRSVTSPATRIAVESRSSITATEPMDLTDASLGANQQQFSMCNFR